MSMHYLHDVAPGIALAVAGWRPEFTSFYVEIYEDGDAWPCPSIELGDDATPITNPEWVIDILDGYATAPADFIETLRRDADKEGTSLPNTMLAAAQTLPAVYQLNESDIPF
jgi:hypothetical protein